MAIVPNATSTPASTHMTGTNQRLVRILVRILNSRIPARYVTLRPSRRVLLPVREIVPTGGDVERTAASADGPAPGEAGEVHRRRLMMPPVRRRTSRRSA